jgi:hypothetical protein
MIRKHRDKAPEILAVEDQADWHENIAGELSRPVLPENPSPELIREIEAQEAKHVVFAKALKKLAKEAR